MEKGRKHVIIEVLNNNKYSILLFLILLLSFIYIFFLLRKLNFSWNENRDNIEKISLIRDSLYLERKEFNILKDSVSELNSMILNMNNQENENEVEMPRNIVWHNKQKYYFFKVDLRKDKLNLNYLKSNSGMKFSDLKNNNLLFATNGGIFEEDYTPTGLLIKKGKVINNLNLKSGTGNFYLKPNGVFYINKEGEVGVKESLSFNEYEGVVLQGIQSGPLLLNHGEIHGKFNKKSNNKFIRNGVGVIDKHTIVFAISEAPVNFYSFAEMFQQKFKCKNALYLDGAISEMFIKGTETNYNNQNFSTIISVYHEE